MCRDDLTQAVAAYMKVEKYRCSFDEEDSMFRFSITLPGKIKQLKCVIEIGEKEIFVYALLPVYGDSDCMFRLAEFVCRANLGLKNGNFELCLESGEVRYKSYIDCYDVVPSHKVIDNAVSKTAITCHRYGPGFLDVIFCGSSAEEAVRLCGG